MAGGLGSRKTIVLALIVTGCANAQALEPSAIDAQGSVTIQPVPPGSPVATLAALGEIDVRDYDDDPPASVGQMTEEAAQAKRLFDNEHWEQASLALKRVSDGETGDDDGNRQLAQYRIAITLFKLKYFQASYAIFAEIAHKAEHVKHVESLAWLARLAILLPEPADVVERIGKYSPEELARFGSAERRELFAQLSTLLGRFKIRNRDYETATTVLAKVDSKSQSYVSAQLAMGAAEQAQRKPERAAAAFERAAAAIGDGAVPAEQARLRNLARLLRGSALYAAAVSTDGAGAVKVDAKLLAAAVKAWQQVEPDSEYWLDAALETASAHVLAGDHASTARSLRWLEAVAVPTTVAFEVDTLTAVVAFRTCRYSEADAAAAKIAQKYDLVLKDLAALFARPALTGDESESGFFELAKQLRAGSTTVPASIRSLLDDAMGDRFFLAQLDYLRLLAEEEGRFKQAPSAFRESALGADVSDVLSLAQEIVVRSAGRLALDRLLRSRDALDSKRSPLLQAITGAAKAGSDKKAAQAQIATRLSQPRARYLMATAALSGQGRKPAAPKTAPLDTALVSKCAP